MDQQRLNELFNKLADNTISETELRELMLAIKDDSIPNLLVDKALQQLQDRPIYKHLINSKRAETSYRAILSDRRFIKSKKTKKFRFIAVASTIVLIIASSIIFYLSNYSSNALTDKNPVDISWSVPFGKQRQIKLSDGTRVWLNAGSRLRIFPDYNKADRKVILYGEAYFDVHTDSNKPFTVKTGTLTTRVLGTAFNVNTFHPEEISITVEKGKVSVQSKQETLSILTENQQIVYNANTKIKNLSTVNAKDAIGWIHRQLKFSNVRLEEAGKTLQRWSNKTIIYQNDAIKDCRFTVSFHEGENLTEMLQVISTLNNLKYELKGDTIYFNGNGCE
ncbi:MAG TPA: FecR domain-containing protein [Pseudosphingobacterium sp.]|nr:FecR domain-containing protein [Pseudosphingobacterium sp.]